MKKKVIIAIVIIVVLVVIYYLFIIKKTPAKKGQITTLDLGIISNPNAPATEQDFKNLADTVTKLGGDIFKILTPEQLTDAKNKYIKNVKKQQHQELLSLFQKCSTSACKNLTTDEMAKMNAMMKMAFELK
jgi:hypothetical protein